MGSALNGWVAPDVGVPEELAKFYFAQMSSGIVSLSPRTLPNQADSIVILA